MAKNEKSTMKMPFRAAQGVSHFFLFDALRTGCEELESANSQLGSTRDRAEKILIKESPVEFESLVQDIMKSCAKSLQTHAAIVEAVAETMKGGIEEHDGSGESPSSKFSSLVGQIKDAAAGVEQLRVVNTKKEKSPPLPTESDFDSEPEVQSSKKPHARKSEENTLLKKKKTKTKHTSNTSAPITETPSSDIPDEKPMKGKGKKLGKPTESSKSSANALPDDQNAATKKLSDILSAKPGQSQTSSVPNSELRNTEPEVFKTDTEASPDIPKPAAAQETSVDQEDIDAEVDARLAAKERKRAKKKASKKRKRDSVASDIFSPEPKAESEHATPVPAKKKARVDKVDVDGKGQRQKIDDVQPGKAKMQKQNTGVGAGEEKVVEANKAKRRRSSNIAVTEAPAATPEINNHKKRRVGF